MGDDRWDEQVGSVAEEAQRLLETLRRAGGGATGGAGPATDGSPDEGPDTHGPEPGDADEWTCTDPFCRACPLCRTVAVVRGLNPETLRRLADLAAVAATVLTDLAAQRASASPRPATAPTSGPAGATDGSPSSPGAARRSGRPIPVRDADDEEVTGD
ncbi:MAG TPA: hypothetical protein VF140_08580 [Phycicoccus sp.]